MLGKAGARNTESRHTGLGLGQGVSKEIGPPRTQRAARTNPVKGHAQPWIELLLETRLEKGGQAKKHFALSLSLQILFIHIQLPLRCWVNPQLRL